MEKLNILIEIVSGLLDSISDDIIEDAKELVSIGNSPAKNESETNEWLDKTSKCLGKNMRLCSLLVAINGCVNYVGLKLLRAEDDLATLNAMQEETRSTKQTE